MKLKDTGLTFQDIKDKVDKYMIETYERMDFLAESAKDQYIYNEKGEKYLDFYAGIAVNSAGSCNEKVVKAVVDQAQTLMHTFNYPYTIPQALLAEKVCTTIGMDKIFLSELRYRGKRSYDQDGKKIWNRKIRSEPLSYRNCKNGIPWKNLWCHVRHRTAGKRMPGRIRSHDLRIFLCTVQ